jgi:NAD(P)H-hydrate repair Nnr-like enzyme with NAD(P)H-hydrate dehydratase domain
MEKWDIKMIAGFTGTQQGMTDNQKETFAKLLERVDELHHGDCIGADADAHRIAKDLKKSVHSYPPINQSKRAFCDADVINSEKEYLVRNHDIVDSSDFLIATPKGNKEELRSGTWATIRYARKVGKKVVIIWPNGKMNV